MPHFVNFHGTTFDFHHEDDPDTLFFTPEHDTQREPPASEDDLLFQSFAVDDDNPVVEPNTTSEAPDGIMDIGYLDAGLIEG